jgi:hypothetical protein
MTKIEKLLPLVKGRWILRPKKEKTEGIESPRLLSMNN